MTPGLFVILPDGTLDKSGARFIDTELAQEAVPIVWPKIADSECRQGRYERLRVCGMSHDSAFSAVARHESCKPLRPFRDGEVICFGNQFADEGSRVVSRDFETQVRYWRMRYDGQSHNMAEMLATGSFPGLKTDSIFNEGKFSGQSQGECAPHHAWLRQQAEAAGVSVTGKWYCSGLASFPGDPTAWVDGRGDVERIAKEKNMTTHGYVEHKGYETDPGEDIEIASDIIDDEVGDILESHPGADAEAVREQVVAIRTGAVDNNPLRCQDYFSTQIG